MCINAPFLIFRAGPANEEWNVVFRSTTTVECAAPVALRSTSRIEIRLHFNGTVRCGVLLSGKVKHFNRLWIQHAHNLPLCKVNTVNSSGNFTLGSAIIVFNCHAFISCPYLIFILHLFAYFFHFVFSTVLFKCTCNDMGEANKLN